MIAGFLIQSILSAKRYTQAIDLAKAARTAYPADTLKFAQLESQALRDSGKVDEGLAVLQDVLTQKPEDPQAHLALLSRMPLPFSMARLRAARIVELGAEGLALTPEESAELVRSVGVDLDPDALDSLHRRTEGWAAGLILGKRICFRPHFPKYFFASAIASFSVTSPTIERIRLFGAEYV